MYSALCLLLVLFAVIAYQYYVLREGFAVTPTTDELRSIVQGTLNGNVDSYTALVNTGLLPNYIDMATESTNGLNDVIKRFLNGDKNAFLSLRMLFSKFNDNDTVTEATDMLQRMALSTTPPSTTTSITSSTTPSLASSLTSLTTSPPLTLPISGPVLTAPTASSVKIADVSPLAAVAQGKQDQSKLLRDIQEVVHNEMMLTKQATTASSQPHLQGEDDDQDCSEPTAPATKDKLSAAEQQGIEASSARSKLCPKDMNKYIRKDGIPCWGCTLDY